MTDVSETAVAFCRESLKWRKAEFSGTSFDELMWVNAPGGSRFLRFGDLSAVMRAVKEWCDHNRAQFRHGITASLNYSSAMAVYKAHVFMDMERVDADAVNPCLALMSACLKAARKLKEKAA